MVKAIDETGNKYGKLRVLTRAPNTKLAAAQWYCICDCGNPTIVKGNYLRSGNTRSCGCLRGKIYERNKPHFEGDTCKLGDFRAYSVIDNYVIPAVLQTDAVRKIPPFDVENYRHVTGKYSWPKAKLPLKIHIDNGKIYGNTVLFDGKFELLPVEKTALCASLKMLVTSGLI